MAPDFRLSATTGESVQLSEFRGLRNLVLVFVDPARPDRAEWLRRLAAQADELEWEETQVLVITGETTNQHLPFPVLLDPGALVHSRYSAVLVVTDRFGEIYAAYRDNLPDLSELLKSLRHINAECPE